MTESESAPVCQTCGLPMQYGGGHHPPPGSAYEPPCVNCADHQLVPERAGDDDISHFVGDDCPGGHESDSTVDGLPLLRAEDVLDADGLAMLDASLAGAGDEPVTSPDLDAAWIAYHEAFDRMEPAETCRSIVEVAIRASERAAAAERERVIREAADALADFGVKFTGQSGVMTHGSMCFVGDGDPLDLNGWYRLDRALAAIEAWRAAMPVSSEGEGSERVDYEEGQ